MDVVTLGAAKVAAARTQAPIAVTATGRRRDPLPNVLNPAFQVPAVAPTVGALASATAIASGTTTVALANYGTITATYDPAAPFEYLGVDPTSGTRNGNAFPEYNYIRFTVPAFYNVNSAPYTVRFMTDGTTLEILFRNYAGQGYWVFVDGQPLTTAPVGTSGTPAQAFLPITFADRRARLIEFRSVGPFLGARVALTDTIWRPLPAGGPTVSVIGDSYSTGTGSTLAGVSGWVNIFSSIMGWPKIIPAAVGGTGYLNPGSGATTFQQRIATDVIPFNPSLVIVMGGHNDTVATNAAYTTSALGTAAGTLFTSLRTALPTAKLVCVGPIGATAAQTTYAAMQAAMFAAVAGIADLTVDTCAPFWWTGTGRVGATTGNGNGDYYTTTDTVHPSQAGHDYLARRMVAALSPLMAA